MYYKRERFMIQYFEVVRIARVVEAKVELVRKCIKFYCKSRIFDNSVGGAVILFQISSITQLGERCVYSLPLQRIGRHVRGEF